MDFRSRAGGKIRIQGKYIYDKETKSLFYCEKQELNKACGIILTCRRLVPKDLYSHLFELNHLKYWLNSGKYIMGDSPEAIGVLFGSKG